MSGNTVFNVPLPQAGHTTRFIAYSKRAIATPTPQGRSEQVRAQTAVTIYPPMSIAKIEEGGRNGRSDGLARLVMDEQSGGFGNPISASIRTQSNPAYDAAVAAFNEQRPIVLATEAKRRAKTKGSKEPISPLTPIQALRGAKASDAFESASMDDSGQNCAVTVAAVNEVPSTECESDPAEWGYLQSNRYGDLAPAGWKFVGTVDSSNEKWREVGALIPDGAPGAAQGGAGVDMEALAKVVRAAVVEALTSAGGASASTPASKSARGRDHEPSMYTPRLGDGRVNLGWVGVQNAYWAMSWVRGLPEAAEADEATLKDATRHVMHLADQVQANSYGHGFTPDRAAKSHELARRIIIDQVALLGESVPVGGDDGVWSDWSRKIGPAAARVLSDLGSLTGEFLSGKAEQSQGAPQQAQQAPREAPAAKPAEQQGSAASAPSAHSPAPAAEAGPDHSGLLRQVAAAWDDANGLAQAWRAAQAADAMGVLVAVTQDPQGNTVVQERPGGQPLGKTIGERGRLLRRQAEQNRPAPAPVVEDEPVAPAMPSQGVQEGLDVPGVPQAGATGALGYPEAVDALAQRLNATAGDEEALHAVFTEARDEALLASQVRFDGKKVQASSTGFAQVALSDAINALVEALADGGAPAQAAPEQAEPSASASAGPSTAAEFLAAAQEAATAAEVESLAAAAEAAGLGDEKVALNGADGPLKFALKFVARQKG